MHRTKNCNICIEMLLVSSLKNTERIEHRYQDYLPAEMAVSKAILWSIEGYRREAEKWAGGPGGRISLGPAEILSEEKS